MTKTTYNPGLYIFRGIVLLLLGMLALLMPGITIATLVFLFGAYMLVDGIFYIVKAIENHKTKRSWGWYPFMGIISIIAGIIAFIDPFAAGIALVFLFGFWIMLAGITAITTAINLRKSIRGEGWYIAAGVISVIFSLLILFNPMAGAITLALFFGFNALANGVLLIVLGIRLKNYNKHEHHIGNNAFA
jgi:uncharacterized membrane protein HdeD (DUF308 family)